MKRIAFTLFALLFGASLNAQNLTAYFSYSVFNSPKDGPYIETYLSVVGKTVRFVPLNGKFQGSIDITFEFKKDSVSKEFRKYNLLSPEISDTINGKVNFIDVQRFLLPAGTYKMDLGIADNNSGSKNFSAGQEIQIDMNNSEPMFSSIQFVESYYPTQTLNVISKNGMDLVPYVSSFFPEALETFICYSEVYKIDKILPAGEQFLVNCYIEDYESLRKFPGLGIFSKETAGPALSFLREMKIDKLPSGNYNVVFEARSKQNKLLAISKNFFQRRNNNISSIEEDFSTVDVSGTFADKINGKDTLAEYIRCLRPISDRGEANSGNNIQKAGDIDMMKRYFYNFWSKRNALEPEQAWMNYFDQVKAVNKSFGNQIEKGYTTDRGRVYLQYGVPDSRSINENEPSAYPYEIWQYNKIGKQSNRKFVFYDPQLVGGYQLLHSDALGETYEPRWQVRLHARENLNPSLDNTKSPDNYGNHAGDNFSVPK